MKIKAKQRWSKPMSEFDREARCIERVTRWAIIAAGLALVGLILWKVWGLVAGLALAIIGGGVT